MTRKELLETEPDALEKLSDAELEKLLEKYFTVTRPERGVETKNKVAATLGVGGRSSSSSKKQPPNLLESLKSILPPEQIAALTKLAEQQKKK